MSPYFRKCKGCNIAKFCDKNCQSFAWNDHKPECKSLLNADCIPDVEVFNTILL